MISYQFNLQVLGDLLTMHQLDESSGSMSVAMSQAEDSDIGACKLV